MSDVLRKQLESDGRMKELSLHLNQLMTSVQDGEKELEARRGQIDAAEGGPAARAPRSSRRPAAPRRSRIPSSASLRRGPTSAARW